MSEPAVPRTADEIVSDFTEAPNGAWSAAVRVLVPEIVRLREELEFAKADITTIYEITCGHANEITRLRRVANAARYLRNSNAWIGDADGIEAMLQELDISLNDLDDAG